MLAYFWVMRSKARIMIERKIFLSLVITTQNGLSDSSPMMFLDQSGTGRTVPKILMHGFRASRGGDQF